jgi:hypothetical protein
LLEYLSRITPYQILIYMWLALDTLAVLRSGDAYKD